MRTIEKPVIFKGRVFDEKAADEVVVGPSSSRTTTRASATPSRLLLPTPRSWRDIRDRRHGCRSRPARDAAHRRRRVARRGSSTPVGSTGGLLFSPGCDREVLPQHHRRPGEASRSSTFVNALVRLRGGEARPRRVSGKTSPRVTGRSDIDIWNLPEQNRAVAAARRLRIPLPRRLRRRGLRGRAFPCGAGDCALRRGSRHRAADHAGAGHDAGSGGRHRRGGADAQPACRRPCWPQSAPGSPRSGCRSGRRLMSNRHRGAPSIGWCSAPRCRSSSVLVAAASSGAAWLTCDRPGAASRPGGRRSPATVVQGRAAGTGRGRNAFRLGAGPWPQCGPGSSGHHRRGDGCARHPRRVHVLARGHGCGAAIPRGSGRRIQLTAYPRPQRPGLRPGGHRLITALQANPVRDGRRRRANGGRDRPRGVGSVSLFEYRAGAKAMPVVVTSGRLPAAADEVLLGADDAEGAARARRRACRADR